MNGISIDSNSQLESCIQKINNHHLIANFSCPVNPNFYSFITIRVMIVPLNVNPIAHARQLRLLENRVVSLYLRFQLPVVNCGSRPCDVSSESQ